MVDRIKKILFVLLSAFLFLPLIQQQFTLIDLKPLKGAITKTEDSTFTIKAYWKEDYQKQNEKYLNTEFGFRSWFIRINNQLAFNLYGKAKANGVIIGKENYLYETNYIKAYTGENFIGKEKIESNVKELKHIQEVLKSKNIDLIVIFAAGKASFFPEFIPDRFLKQKSLTNYEYYSAQVKHAGINYIDFNKYFMEHKNTSPYPLYPKTGIHWSVYGSELVADSLSTYIAKLRNIDAPKLQLKNIVMSDSLQGTDKDIEEGMNLLIDIRNNKMAYPVLEFNEKNKQKARVLTIGDSYYWGIFGSGIASRLFERPEFWYYFKEVNIAGEATKSIAETSILNEIQKQDVIVLMATEATLNEFPWGFIEKMGELHLETINQSSPASQSKSERQQKIDGFKQAIRESSSWLESVRKKAILNKIPLDSMITLDAIYMVDFRDKK